MTKWLGAVEAAEHMGFASKTLANWRAQGIGPAFRKIGRAIRYDVEELDRFIDTNGAKAA